MGVGVGVGVVEPAVSATSPTKASPSLANLADGSAAPPRLVRVSPLVCSCGKISGSAAIIDG